TPNLQLTAIVESESQLNPGTTPILWVNDQFSGWVATPMVGVPSDFQPDVIIGNDIFTSNQYIVGVVGVIANDVWLYTYSVSGEGTGILTVTNTGSYNISASGNIMASPAHIDIEAQYSTPFLGGQPTCDNFAITWEDMAVGIMGYFASLSNPTGGTPTTINALGGMVLQPDVALVERLNPLTNLYEDWALFGYMQSGPPPQKLIYQEWNTAATPGIAVTYDNTHNYLPYGYVASGVRIDAIDDYTLNMPGPGVYPGTPPAPNAYFDMVVAAANPMPPARAAVLEFNNKLGAGVWKDITTPVAALANNMNWVPVVTCGPGQFYSVGYASTQGPGPL
ncbi:MAG TPA: hypothetical protein VLD19_16390, partial [Chitinophagaceae bacterium]|nr:hypothetical protein [Chitinophagaceae bacterium]